MQITVNDVELPKNSGTTFESRKRTRDKIEAIQFRSIIRHFHVTKVVPVAVTGE